MRALPARKWFARVFVSFGTRFQKGDLLAPTNGEEIGLQPVATVSRLVKGKECITQLQVTPELGFPYIFIHFKYRSRPNNFIMFYRYHNNNIINDCGWAPKV